MENKAKEVTDESSERKTTSARSFQTGWLRDHTWLHLENGAVFCHFCRKLKKTNPFKFVVHFEIFSMLGRPSEMKNVPPRITQRDKLTLSIQIQAQTLLWSTLQWSSIPSRTSRDTPCHFMVEELE